MRTDLVTRAIAHRLIAWPVVAAVGLLTVVGLTDPGVLGQTYDDNGSRVVVVR